MANKTRVGIGYDVHRLVSGRKLVLGGVDIPYEKGLDGWSDADVLLHAVMDALLGAAALGDLGTHFPPGDSRYKDISSLVMLAEVKNKVTESGLRIGSIDATILAEEPKLKDFMDSMRGNISRTLAIDMDMVSVKATTTEKLGFVGRGEGIAAQAIALLISSG
jgi:2-C-methyl-D-erythritol 2,4-cyclodiphosphate synthase